MKIGEVEVGKVYGILDSPQSARRFSSARMPRARMPRKFEVMEIVTVEERRRSGGYYGSDKKVNVKRVKGKVLDGGGRQSRWRGWEPIGNAAKGAVLVIEARQVVGPWEGRIADEVEAEIQYEEARNALTSSLEKRLTALIGKPPSKRTAYVTTDKNRDTNEPIATLRVSGQELETLLALAEKGKGSA